jgi:hypothetical protein
MRCLAREHIDLVVAPVPITQTTNVVRMLFVLEWRGGGLRMMGRKAFTHPS